TARFFTTILTTDKYRRALPPRGVRIIGANFSEPLDLENAEITHEVWLDKSLLRKGARFSGLRSTRPLTFDGSKVIGTLDMFNIRVESVYARESAELDTVILESASIGRSLDFASAKLSGPLQMPSINIGENLNADGVVADELALENANIRGHLFLSESKIGK